MPPMMSVTAGRHHMVVDEWELHRKTLYRLFVAERKSCKEISDYMKNHHQFHKKPRDYEYHLKKWRYRQNLKGAEWKYVGYEIEKRKRLGKDSDVLLAGRRQLPERVRQRTLFHRSPPRLCNGTSPRAPLNHSGEPEGMVLHVQTPSLVVFNSEWPRDLPWLKFNEKFGDLLTTQIHQATDSTFVADGFRSPQAFIDIVSTNFPNMVHENKLSVESLSGYLDMICPETHDGDHMSSADILLTGPRESASIELLKLAVYLLSNNMELGSTGLDAVDLLKECGLLTKSNIHWLTNACDETSEALVDALLLHSLFRRDTNLLSWLLDGRVDVHRTTRIPTSSTSNLLEIAVEIGNIRCCEILLNAGADPNRRAHKDTESLLEFAARKSNATLLVKLLLSRGASLTESTKAKILSEAILRENSSLALEMIQRGAEVSPETIQRGAEDMMSPCLLHNEIFCGCYERIEMLLEAGADPNRVDYSMTPVEFICYYGGSNDIKILELLLKFGGRADRQENTFEPSALQLAAYRGRGLIVQILLKDGADVNACLPEDASCLPRYPDEPQYAPTPLLTALRESHSKVAKTILRYRPRFLGPELAEAARIGDLKLVDMLFAAGARLRGDELDYAVEYRNPEIIYRLLQKEVKITKRTSALEIALLLCDFDAILFELYDTTTAYDSRCLYEATSLVLKEERYLFVVEKLVSMRPIAIRDDLEVAALAIAVINRNSQLCCLLSHPKFLPGSWVITLHPFLGTRNQKTRPYWRPYIGRITNIFEIYPWMSHSTQIDSKNTDHYRIHVLELAAQFESAFSLDYAVRALIELGVIPGYINIPHFLKVYGRDGPLVRIIEACQRTGTWLGIREKYVSLSLVFAVGHRLKEVVKILLDAGADANVRPTFHRPCEFGLSRTPLQKAIEVVDVDTIMLLLKAGADVNAPAGYTRGATCLQLAAIGGNIGIVRMLLDRGANVNAPRARFSGRTAIEGAAENGRLDTTKLLLLHQEDNMFQQHRIQFIRAVKLATEEGHHAIANMLKKHIQWNGHDQALYEDIDIWECDIIDEMTQELSPYELKKLGIHHSTDWIGGIYPSDISENGSYVSSDDGESDDISGGVPSDSEDEDEDMLSDSSDKPSEIGSRHEEQEATSAVPTDAFPGDYLLGLSSVGESQDIPGDDVDMLDIDTSGSNTGDSPHVPLYATPGLGLEEIPIEEIHQQHQGHLPIFSIGDFSTSVLERPDWNPFRSADVEDVTEEPEEDFL